MNLHWVVALGVALALPQVVEQDIEIPVSDYGAPVASQTLVDHHVFANSFGEPVVVAYTPPDAGFNHAVLTLEVSTFGRQYDRMVHVNLGGVELWRPTLPEPLFHNVTATLTHDASALVSLLQQPNEFVFDLGNIVEGVLNGTFDVTFTVDYYETSTAIRQENSWYYDSPATNVDVVIPSTVAYPQQNATGYLAVLPRNTTRAVLRVYASGNSNEEFWYSNTWTQGGGPTRLIQVFVNEKLTGVADPFPVIFSGGIDPGLWFPNNGLKTGDVPEYYIDITPFLPMLWESSASVDIGVGDGFDLVEPLSDWLISAALLTWQEPDVYGSGSFGSIKTLDDSAAGNYSAATAGAAYSHEVVVQSNLAFTNLTTNLTSSGTSKWTQSAVQRNAQISTTEIWYLVAEGQGTSEYTWTPINGPGLKYTRSHAFPMMIIQNNNTIAIDRHYQVETNQPFTVDQYQLAEVLPAGNSSTFQTETEVQATFGGNAPYLRRSLATNLTLTNDIVSSSPFSSGTYSNGDPEYASPYIGRAELAMLLAQLNAPFTAEDFIQALPEIIDSLGNDAQANAHRPAAVHILQSLT